MTALANGLSLRRMPVNQRFWLTTDSVSLDIDAAPDRLYALISDLPRIGEWSPECERVEWDGDVATPVEGSTFVGHNAVGPGRRIRYRRHGTVLTAEPGKAFSFITDEGGRPSTAWHYTFEPIAPGRTRVTEAYEVRWIPTWARILDVPTNRHKELLAGMRTTLDRLKATAEGTS